MLMNWIDYHETEIGALTEAVAEVEGKRVSVAFEVYPSMIDGKTRQVKSVCTNRLTKICHV